MSAVEREALACSSNRAPISSHRAHRALVAAHPHKPLIPPAWVHRERELDLVLGDRERPRVLTGAAARVCSPSRRERLNDVPAVAVGDLLTLAVGVQAGVVPAWQAARAEIVTLRSV